MEQLGPIDPFKSRRQIVQDSLEADSETWGVLYVGFNPRTPGLNFWNRLLSPLMLKESCPTCEQPIRVPNVDTWRLTGSGLICNFCAKAKPDTIVAADNFEQLELAADYSVALPDRAKVWQRQQEDARDAVIHILNQEADAISEMIEAAPDNPWLYVHRAQRRPPFSQDREADLDRAVELAPDDPAIRGWRATERFGQPAHETVVIVDLEAIVASDFACFDAYDMLAGVYPAGDPRAESILIAACERWPDDDSVWCSRAVQLFGLGKPTEAMAAIERALELRPFNPLYLHLRDAD